MPRLGPAPPRPLRPLVPPVVLAAASVLAGACAGPPPDLRASAAASWPEADALFHRGSPAWLGSDAAYSIDLGDGRVLWLFGDTFVATSAANLRSESEMVRNTVALQDGLDPLTAGFAPAWGRGGDGTPDAFFRDPALPGDRWLWPGHGVRIPDGPLVVFLSLLRPTPGDGLGFAGDGWRIAVIDDPDAPPATWAPRFVDAPPQGHDAVVGTAVAVDGDHVIALAAADAGSHPTYLARVPRAALATGDLSTLAWWTGDGWTASGALHGPPATLFDDGATEASLHHDTTHDRWIYVCSRGFGASTLVMRTAPRPEGPWSAAEEVFEPPESRGAEPFVYAGKAHTELAAGGDLALTYATNSFDFGDLFTPEGARDLYWPRFVRITLAPR